MEYNVLFHKKTCRGGELNKYFILTKVFRIAQKNV